MTTSPSDTFVARGAELAALRRCAAEARASRPRVVLIAGQGGMGKTTLVRRFLRELGDAAVLRASADEPESSVTYGLIAGLMRGVRAQALRRMPALSAGPLATADPLVVGAELAQLVGALEATVVVEDLHWSDVASAEALLLAARRLTRVRVLVLITHRPDELPRLGGRWERFAVTEEHCVRLDLAGFDSGDVSTLTSAVRGIRLSKPMAERIVDHTGGNPLYVRALLDELPEAALRQFVGPLPAPRSLADVIIGRLANLPRPTRELVIAAAILGRSCALETAAKLAGIEDAAEALEAAQEAHLLSEVPGSGGREIAFVHPLVHAAVYGDIGPVRRRSLHRGAAVLMSDRTAALAHTVAATSGTDSELAEELEHMALADAARGDFIAAANHHQQASELSDSPGLRERRLIRALGSLLQAGDAATAATRRPDVERCARSAARDHVLGQLAFLTGQAVEGEHLLRSAWELRHTGDEVEPCIAAALLLGESYLLSRPPQEAERLLREAVALCPADHPFRSVLASELCGALGVSGQGREGLALLGRYLTRDASGCAGNELDAVALRGLTRLWCEDLAGAHADLSGVVARAHQGLSGHRFIQAMSYLGEVKFRLGLWDEAVQHGKEAIRAAYDTQSAWAYPFIHSQAALPFAARGDWVEALQHVNAAAQTSRAYGVVAAVAFAANAVAFLAWLQGDTHGVIAAVEGLEGKQGGGIGEPGILGYEAQYIDALISAGRLPEAATALDALEERARGRALPAVLLDCARLRGVLATTRNYTEAAYCAFEQGHAIAGAAQVPLGLGIFRLAHGCFLRRQGQKRTALSALRSAREIFDQLGARPFLVQVDQEINRCGIRTHRAARTPLDLSERERDIAELLVKGRTNPEIAEELFVTAKTVEYHLARMYAKLGAASRTEAAAILARRAKEPS